MQYYELTPESPAHRAKNTRDPSDPRIVTSAHLDFEYPLVTSLIVSLRAYAATDPLIEDLRDAKVSGFEAGEITAGVASWVDDPGTVGAIPHLTALVIRGKEGVDDMILDDRGRLLVSKKALDIILQSDPDLMFEPFDSEG